MEELLREQNPNRVLFIVVMAAIMCSLIINRLGPEGLALLMVAIWYFLTEIKNYHDKLLDKI